MEERIKITSRNFKISNKIVNFIEEKISKIEKFVKRNFSIQIVLGKTRYLYTSEILCFLPNDKVVKVKTSGKELMMSLEKSIDKVKSIILKFKDKNINRKKNLNNIDIKDKKVEISKDIVNVEMLSEEEALKKFNKSKKNIFIFFNKDTQKFCLLKKNYSQKIEFLELDLLK